MLNRAAEDSFEKGHRALNANDWRAATAFFEAALMLEKKLTPRAPQARYRSYYGLCLGLAKKRHDEAIKMCQSAIQLERYNPDLHWNLGRVLNAAGRKREAYRVFVQGVKQQPRHKGLVKDIKRMGLRKRPVLRFLRRNHPLNVALGKMRAESEARVRLSQRRVIRRA
jgi:tetratricopeptide (TPR) repeat protein